MLTLETLIIIIFSPFILMNGLCGKIKPIYRMGETGLYMIIIIGGIVLYIIFAAIIIGIIVFLIKLLSKSCKDKTLDCEIENEGSYEL